MSRDKPLVQAIKLLTLIERNGGGMRVTDMAERLGANTRAVYRYLQALQKLPVPLYTDKDGKESYWKIDPDYRSRLSIPFTLSELLSLYFAQDSLRSVEGTVLFESLDAVFDKVRAGIPKALFKQMIDLRASFRSGIPAQKEYRTYREFIKIIQDAIQERKTLQLQYTREIKTSPNAGSIPTPSIFTTGLCT